MKKIIVDCLSNQIRTALLEDGQLTELIVEDRDKKIAVGNIYVGKVSKILPSQFAFIDLGDDKNSFLQLNDKKEKSLYTVNGSGVKELAIKQGQDIIVQVIKEAGDEKGAVVTTQLSFSGKYVVLLYNDRGIGISKKIEDKDRISELKGIAESVLPKGYGLIMRTNCQYAEENTILSEIEKLISVCNGVLNKGQYAKAPFEIYCEVSNTQKMIRDLMTKDTDEIIINDRDEFEEIMTDMPECKVTLYEGVIPLFHNYYVESQIEKALNNKQWLKSGGFLIIDQTEAMTVIDVNTGKHTGKTHRQTVLKTNIEAVEEIAKIMRVRNFSGMIIIDFIDMEEKEDREKIYNALVKITKQDRIKTIVVGMTELGLMQLTRKKTRKPLNKVLKCRCPMCEGTGEIPNEQYISDKIRNQVINIFTDTIYNYVVVSANKKVISAFKGKDDEYKRIEKKYNGKIELEIIETGRFDYFEIKKCQKGSV